MGRADESYPGIIIAFYAFLLAGSSEVVFLPELLNLPTHFYSSTFSPATYKVHARKSSCHSSSRSRRWNPVKGSTHAMDSAIYWKEMYMQVHHADLVRGNIGGSRKNTASAGLFCRVPPGVCHWMKKRHAAGRFFERPN